MEKHPLTSPETIKGPPIKYVEVTIDEAFMKENLMPSGGLRMHGGQANWDGEVVVNRYVASNDLSPEHRMIAEDKIKKYEASQERTYQHESHHIKNRENDLTPHVAAENLREFLAFRVLDELSAFVTGELYNQDLVLDNILAALQKSKVDIEASYYSGPFTDEAKWYMSQPGNKTKAASRTINQEKYHRVMRQYFNIKGKDILQILGEAGKMSEFTEIVNGLIISLDNIINSVNSNK